MFDWTKQTILVTGATSGLGLELVRKTTAMGAEAIMIARNAERLQEVRQEVTSAGGKARAYPFDLEEVAGIPALLDRIKADLGGLPSILVNNVGYNPAGFILNTPLEVIEKNFQVNTFAPILLMQKIIPDMLEQKRGVVMNIMSGVMYHSFPGCASYCASKEALGAFHESLQAELADLPVHTVWVNPGGFQSNYYRDADKRSEGRLKEYQFPEFGGPRPPEQVAARLCKAIERRENHVDLGALMDRAGFHLNYWFPKLVDRIIVMRNRKLLQNRF